MNLDLPYFYLVFRDDHHHNYHFYKVVFIRKGVGADSLSPSRAGVAMVGRERFWSGACGPTSKTPIPMFYGESFVPVAMLCEYHFHGALLLDGDFLG